MDDQLQVQIKGVNEGLLITLDEGDWLEVKTVLLTTINQQADFLRGGNLIIDVGDRVISNGELSNLKDDLTQMNLVLWAVLSSSLVTQQNAQLLGLATRLNKPAPDQGESSLDTALSGERAVFIRRTLRSGFSLKYDGHVIVAGDANPGSEIIAFGDIVVWGHLRGMAHAGADGDENAAVYALDLSPTQLRIAGKIALTPQRQGKVQPEMACIIDGQVVAIPWESKGR
jgi:septum site-determining protein MinC